MSVIMMVRRVSDSFCRYSLRGALTRLIIEIKIILDFINAPYDLGRANWFTSSQENADPKAS